jgi:hypothetical protein
MNVIKLYNEVDIMLGLKADTITLIHHTQEIKPVKKLVEVHEIIDLSLAVQQLFKDYKDAPIWDLPALKDLNHIRCELMVYYHMDFHPFSVLDKFNKDLLCFFNIMELRTKNSVL